MRLQKGTADLRSPAVGVRDVAKTTRSSQKQNKEVRRKLAHD